MLIGVFGTWTPLAFWGYGIVKRVMARLYGAPLHIHCNTIEEFKNALQARDGQPVLLTSDCPDPMIVELIRRQQAPVLFFIDGPDETVAFAMRALSFSLAGAIDFTTHRFCTLADVLSIEGGLRFDHNTHDGLVTDVEGAIETYLRARCGAPSPPARSTDHTDAMTDPSAAVSSSIVAEFPFARDDGRYLSEFATDVQGSIQEFAHQYSVVYDGGEITRCRVPLPAFQQSEIGHKGGGHFDLSGPRRFLTWGPYLHLPPGQWMAEFEIEVTENHSGNGLEVDVLDGSGRIAVAKAPLPVQGSFTASLAFEVDQIDRKIDLRVFLLEGAIEGRLALRNFRFTKVSQASPLSPERSRQPTPQA